MGADDSGAGRVELHIEVDGDGPCVALAHGFGGSARNFRRQARALRPRYRAAVFDLRGHARSGAPEDPRAYALGALAGDFERVLERAGAERACVGGLSLGAALALRFALERPARVEALVLASYPAFGGGARARAFAEAIERQGLAAAGERFAWGPDSGLDEGGAALVRQGFLEHAPRALAHVLREALAELPSPEALAPRLAGLDRPVLLVAGGSDAGSLAACRRLAALLPRARLEVIPGAGHVVNLARPRDFDALLLGFLASAAGGAPPGPQEPPSSRSRRNG